VQSGLSAKAPRALGLVALGDSITVGEGSMALGVTPLSWAQWLARALDLPYSCYAFNGATTSDVLREQLPRVRAYYDVAALYAGVNDIRDPGFDLAAYKRDLDAIAAGLVPHAGRLLMLTLPHDLGRSPRTPRCCASPGVTAPSSRTCRTSAAGPMSCPTPSIRRRWASSRSPIAQRARSARRCRRRSSPAGAPRTCATPRRMRGPWRATSRVARASASASA
jgi:GDSL-like Lipase/Acylhydrolase family